MEIESDTLAFVRTNFPHTPVPEVIHEWVDEKLNRTFLIMKHIEGRTLADAWPSLSQEKRDDIASTVAEYISQLTSLTSDRYQSPTGRGLSEPFFDLGPTNILVTDDGVVTELLDWESAGFYPKFWIALKPYLSAEYYLPPDIEDRYA
ncbi:hypothetical protein BDW74DRAFT_184055 [Aspergillus multicolor]|uniref:aminoglycoside phosphotransferase family protein n=1 Tax=Aspergillus multicolor TaxID=41759 RepID=UPI003CCE26B2